MSEDDIRLGKILDWLYAEPLADVSIFVDQHLPRPPRDSIEASRVAGAGNIEIGINRELMVLARRQTGVQQRLGSTIRRHWPPRTLPQPGQHASVGHRPIGDELKKPDGEQHSENHCEDRAYVIHTRNA